MCRDDLQHLKAGRGLEARLAFRGNSLVVVCIVSRVSTLHIHLDSQEIIVWYLETGHP